MKKNTLDYLHEWWPYVCGGLFTILLIAAMFSGDLQDYMLPFIGIWANIIIIEIRRKKN